MTIKSLTVTLTLHLFESAPKASQLCPSMRDLKNNILYIFKRKLRIRNVDQLEDVF
jgi:hypothetical protein